MSQTLDCEFVGKHFTTLCLHRAVGDPTSHYSALWSPEQLRSELQEREREAECIFESETWGKIRKQCFGILKLDHQLYSFSHLPQEWERLAVTGGDRKLMAVCKGKVTERHDVHNDLCKWHPFLSQQLPWFALILLVAFVNNSPTPLKPWGWFAFSITDEAFLAVGAISGEHYSIWSLVWIWGGVEAEGDQRCAVFSMFEE